MNRFIQIDEEGFFCFGELRVDDFDHGLKLFQNLKFDDRRRLLTQAEGCDVFVEAFDAPFVVKQIFRKNSNWVALMPYGLEKTFKLENLSLDEWDRFHGIFEHGDVGGDTNDGDSKSNHASSMPFVFSRAAQSEFFNLLSGFSDDSISFKGQTYHIGPWILDNIEAYEEKFWTNIYLTEKPRWDLGEKSPVLEASLFQLKLPKSRIAVLGCGTGHDAAFFAEAGHIVTAFDISSEAIAQGQKLYSNFNNLTFVQADIFKLPKEFDAQFDLCFEHTCYCAIAPSQRNNLVKVWNKLLSSEGSLLGIFYVQEKTIGPPFGASEWEIKKRLEKYYQNLYWTRAKNSIERRLSKELVVFAKKRNF